MELYPISKEELRQIFITTASIHDEILKLTRRVNHEHSRLLEEFETLIKDIRRTTEAITESTKLTNKIVDKALVANQKVLEAFMRLNQ